MGELILCRQSIAAIPYYIEEGSLNVYSLEELSYYIVHNVYLINDGFRCVELCNWIGRELGQKELEKQLLEQMKEGTPLHIFVGHILSYCGYLTAKEMRDTIEIIAGFENKSVAECRKMRADRLMEKNKISDAIYEYESLLENCKKGESLEFQGNVWHNLGTAYARLFFFDEAAHCYEMAYQRNRRLQSRNAMLYALRCGKSEEAFQNTVAKYQVTPEDVTRICEEVTRQSRDEKICLFEDQIDKMRKEYPDEDDLKDKMAIYINQWKKDYITLCGI